MKLSLTKVDLDDFQLIRRIDRSDMLGAVGRLPDPLRNRVKGIAAHVRTNRIDLHNLVLMGMGGSASAADVVLDWLGSELKIPYFVHRESRVPSFVDERTLFVAVSYSGETVETLTAFHEARRQGAMVAGVGTGGKLAKICAESKAAFVDVEPSVAPRAALSQLIVGITQILESLALIRSTSREMIETGRELVILKDQLGVRSPLRENRAKRLATEVLGRSLQLYSLQEMASVARRFKNQLAENSKQDSKYDILPEACHNEIETWRDHSDRTPLFIRCDESRFERSVVEAFQSTIRSAGANKPIDVRVPGRSRLSALLAPILLLDFVSVYLALLNGIDPTPTRLIAKYKGKL